MKKISVLAVLATLSIPVMAEEITTTGIYGTLENEPSIEQKELNQDVVVAQDEVKQDTVVEQKNESVENEVVDEKEINKDVTVQQEEVSVVEQYTKQAEEPKYDTESKVSNPKIRFPHGLQLGLGVSPTSGLNGFVGYNNKNFDSFWAKRFGVRFDFATYSPIKNKLNKRINDYIGDEGIEIDDNLNLNNAKINAKHMGAIVDFYPFGDTWFLGGLRVSGGYMKGDLNLKADIQGTKQIGSIEFELGDRKYSYDGNEMHGKAAVDWKYSGPYLGAGFDLGIFRGFKLFVDAGVVFADNHAKIDLNVPLDNLKDITVPGEVIDIIENSSNPIVKNAYDQYVQAKADALSEAQKELDKIDYYPIVKLGFMYRF